MAMTQRRYGPVQWSEAFMDRIFRKKEVNDHPSVDEKTVKAWTDRLDSYTARAAMRVRSLVESLKA